MPLRYTSIRSVLNRGLDRLVYPLPNASLHAVNVNLFHTSRALQHDASNPQNHYETLNVHPDATHAEIKKSFYTLSKLHHPDVNPDPHASRRFTRISEAYSILSHTEKRARYDRDVLRLHHRTHHRTTTGPAGGRPASGLSPRRSTTRGTFYGPPPSFFRSGGWGSQSSKRRAAHEDSTGTAGAGYNPETNTGKTARNANTGGMGPGQRAHPYAGHWSDEVPRHFDKEGHERTHRRADERRAARRRVARRWGEGGRHGDEEVEEGDMMRMVVVTGMLVFAALAPVVGIYAWGKFADWISGRGGRTRRDEVASGRG